MDIFFFCYLCFSGVPVWESLGSIINISSVVGLQGNIGQSVYSASKSAIIGRQGTKETNFYLFEQEVDGERFGGGLTVTEFWTKRGKKTTSLPPSFTLVHTLTKSSFLSSNPLLSNFGSPFFCLYACCLLGCLADCPSVIFCLIFVCRILKIPLKGGWFKKHYCERYRSWLH